MDSTQFWEELAKVLMESYLKLSILRYEAVVSEESNLFLQFSQS